MRAPSPCPDVCRGSLGLRSDEVVGKRVFALGFGLAVEKLKV